MEYEVDVAAPTSTAIWYVLPSEAFGKDAQNGPDRGATALLTAVHEDEDGRHDAEHAVADGNAAPLVGHVVTPGANGVGETATMKSPS